MKKIIVVGSVLLFLLLVVWTNAQGITLAELRQQLKDRLAQSSPDFSDDNLDMCLWMGMDAIVNHGLARPIAFPEISGTLAPNQQHTGGLGVFGELIFPVAVIKTSGGQRRSLLETELKDIGHRHLDTDVPLSYYCFYRDADSAVLFIYPPSAQQETLLVAGYRNWDNLNLICVRSLYEGVWLDYALFVAYLRLENYRSAAIAYNNYAQEIARLREELVNAQPDIIVAPKIIK